MKIRTDFVTNSSSSSFVAVSIHCDIIQAFLAEHGLEDIFNELFSTYEDATLNVELTTSISQSLSTILTEYLESRSDGLDPDIEDALDELIALLDSDPNAIDASAEGEIELTEAYGEDGFGYYQHLSCYNRRGELVKWPSADGKIYDEEFGQRLLNGEIEALAHLAYDAVWDIVWDESALTEAVEATGTTVKFEPPLPQPPIQVEGTDWISGCIFVLTGLSGDEIEQVTELIEHNGGVVKSSTVLKTNYVIYNPAERRQTTKMKKAKELIERGKPITLLTVKGFMQKIGKAALQQDAPVQMPIPTTLAEAEQIFDCNPHRDARYICISGLTKKYKSVKNLIIPGCIDGMPVAVSGSSFGNNNALESVTFLEGVAAIGPDCFNCCKRLKEMTFASSIHTIGSGLGRVTPWQALMGDWIIINGIVVSYTGHTAEVIVPDGVTHIGPYAFHSLQLERLVLPNSVSAIGNYAFVHCRNLKEIVLPAAPFTLGSVPFHGTAWANTFDNWIIINGVLCGYSEHFYQEFLRETEELVLPDGITKLSDNLFSTSVGELMKVTSIHLPEGLVEIGKSAFLLCKMLRRVSFPSSLKHIDEYAFSGCEQLQEVQLPEGLETIGGWAFANCTQLEVPTLPASVNVAKWAFNRCKSKE